MIRGMSDDFAFQKRFDVSQTGWQADVKHVDRQGGDPEKREDEERRDDDDAAFETEDAHGSTARDHHSVDDEPKRRVENQEHDEEGDRTAREKIF
jgi:hypothetical protein